MAWIVRLEEVIEGKVVRRSRVARLERPTQLNSLDDLGLHLADAKHLLARIQREIVTNQIQRDAETRVQCPACGKRRRVKDYRPRRLHTLFGSIQVRVPRFVCPTAGCAGTSAQSASPAALNGGRSTPEYDATRAKLAAQLP